MSDSYKATIPDPAPVTDISAQAQAEASLGTASGTASAGLSAFPGVWERVTATDTVTTKGSASSSGAVAYSGTGTASASSTATSTAPAVLGTAAPSLTRFTQQFATTITETDLNNLEEASELAAECASLCCCMARTTKGALRRCCRSLYASCEASLARLRTQIYIQTGTLYSPPIYGVPCTGGTDTMRRLIATEEALQALCETAITETSNPSIADTFAYCETCSRRRQTIEETICGCML
ncbi:MAG: hypothetical protein LBO63_05935 [Oscillospiraceae bacterium]|jgi:hypothetical protein|nr:hypothetical protein [Oscillospiraceae bacterium]